MFDRLIQQGHQISVFAPVQHGTSPKPLYGGMLDGYAKVVPCYHKNDRFWFTYKQNKIYDALLASFDINQFDIIHSHTLFSGGYVSYKIHKICGIPYVITVRNTDVNFFFKYALHLRKTGIEILRNASKIIFISTRYREKFFNNFCTQSNRELLQEKSQVISNGIEDFWIENINDQKSSPDKEHLKLIFAGQIKKGKNIPIIINACNILKERGYGIKLTVIGKIMDKKLGNDIIKSPFVEYLPFVQKEELINIYREHDIFVMPSKHETFGRVYAEAITQGLPIIYTKGEGFDGLFENGFVGYAVKSADQIEIADKIEDIIKNYHQISTNCIKSAGNFDWDASMRAITGVYEEALSYRG
ncbi:Glycosyltransferase involved in cell wall bisynthesis [Syntrophus gentianae]|uniref:Glycosyltransferase involved in cell wall bisynthesis n=2 Tax=Syntrophus gentianae TaxID=43775 RepID=A0A1H7V7A4_9BACT|nr:Glycosyltransferase involved in cell wall bisynthesis [Syntrophus gentianae]